MEFIMKINEPCKLQINDFIHISVLYDGEHVTLLDSGNYPDASIFEIIEEDGLCNIIVAGIPFYVIDLTNGFCMKSNKIIPTNALRVSSNVNKDYDLIEDRFTDRRFYIKRNIELEETTHTELHTHFMEMITGEEFLKIILKYVNGVYVDHNGNLLGSYSMVDNELDLNHGEKFISANDILNDRQLFDKLSNQLVIPPNEIVNFSMIHTVLCRRNALLDYASYLDVMNDFYHENLFLDDLNNIQVLKAERKTKIYIDILVRALESLRDKDITYVELSFSTPNTIKRIQEEMKYHKVDGIEYRFLLSENRNKEGIAFREFVYDSEKDQNVRNKKSVIKYLRNLIDEGYVTGFDLMGMEQYISDYDYIPNSHMGSSLFDKLEQVIITLHDLSIEKNDPSILCRLHSGENYYPFSSYVDKGNPEKTLEILEAIQNKYKEDYNKDLIIPPPSIRLGHGLYFDKDDKNFVELLKKYKVVVEINASSNHTLGNVDTIRNIPYSWYYENGIPFVLATDGGGFYLTNPNDEDIIASTFGGKKIVDYAIEGEKYALESRGLK